MFFPISKVFGIFVQPSCLLILALGFGVILLWTRWRKIGRSVSTLAALILAIFAFSPLGNVLIHPLENQFARPSELQLEEVRGIIVLGGSFDTAVSMARKTMALNESAERIVETLALARRLPSVPIIFTGGVGTLFFAQEDEASAARRMFSRAGLSTSRMLLEDKSRNTHENAEFVKQIVQPMGEGQWLLITSAYHMPRAVGCFRRAGVDVLPWPVDYRTRGGVDFARMFRTPSEGLQRMDTVSREWVGLLAYWLTGRTSVLWPGPVSG